MVTTKKIARTIDVLGVRGDYRGCKTTLIVVNETPKLLHTRSNPNLNITANTPSEAKKGIIVWSKETKKRRYTSPYGKVDCFEIEKIHYDVTDAPKATTKKPKVEAEVETPVKVMNSKHMGMYAAMKRFKGEK